MKHEIKQISRNENGAVYKIMLQIPFSLGWIERVKFYVSTREQKNVYQLNHTKNENDIAYFEATVELPRYAVYHYYF